MKTRISLLLICILMAPGPLAADEADQNINRFVESYYQAYRKNDVTLLRSLIYPASLKCIDAAAPTYFQQSLSISLHDSPAVAPPWQPFDITPLKSMPQFTQLPVEPERGINFSWSEGGALKGKDQAMQILLVSYEGHYMQVLPCPTAEQVKNRNAFFSKKR